MLGGWFDQSSQDRFDSPVQCSSFAVDDRENCFDSRRYIEGSTRVFFEMGHIGTRAESEAYGFAFMEDSERLAAFEEAVQIIKLMWIEDASSFDASTIRSRVR